MIYKFNSLFVTLFGIGRISKIPGSIASLVTIIFLFFIFQILDLAPDLVLICLIVIFFVSLYSINQFIKNKETDALYNLRDEISEQTNLKSEKNNIYDSLNFKFKKWSSTLMDPMFYGLLANDEYNKLNPDRFTY